MHRTTTAIAGGYASLNLRAGGLDRPRRDTLVLEGRGVVDGVETLAPEVTVDGGHAPTWDVVHFMMADGRTADIGFQIVASRLGERPVFPLKQGDEIDLATSLGFSSFVTLRTLAGRLRLAVGWLADVSTCSLPGFSARASEVGHGGRHTWSHDLHVAVEGETFDVPRDGWHRVTSPAATFDVSGYYLRAERPSAQFSHLRFAVLARDP